MVRVDGGPRRDPGEGRGPLAPALGGFAPLDPLWGRGFPCLAVGVTDGGASASSERMPNPRRGGASAAPRGVDSFLGFFGLDARSGAPPAGRGSAAFARGFRGLGCGSPSG
jgi:hypothetical protein